MVGYDSSAHIAEETKNAAVAGGRSPSCCFGSGDAAYPLHTTPLKRCRPACRGTRSRAPPSSQPRPAEPAAEVPPAHLPSPAVPTSPAGPAGLIMAIIGSFICGWAFLLSLTFSMQSPADGVAGTQQVTAGGGRARTGSRGGAPQLLGRHAFLPRAGTASMPAPLRAGTRSDCALASARACVHASGLFPPA